jgi:hypothetical protein
MRFKRGKDIKATMEIGSIKVIEKIESYLEEYKVLILSESDLNIQGFGILNESGNNLKRIGIQHIAKSKKLIYEAPVVIIKYNSFWKKEKGFLSARIIKSRFNTHSEIKSSEELISYYRGLLIKLETEWKSLKEEKI